MASATESSPLLPQYHHAASSNTSPRGNRPPRTVTFNPLTTVSTYHDPASADPKFRPLASGNNSSLANSRPTGLSALNSKLRRRNSHGAPGSVASSYPASKIGPQRTTKTAQKLKLLPDPITEEELVDEETSPSDVYRQIARIKEPAARSLAAKLGKADRDRLPRVTAYCTANSYRLDGVFKFLKSRSKTRGANPKLFDECVYSRFDYQFEAKQKAGNHSNNVDSENAHTVDRMPRERRFSDSAVEVNEDFGNRREELIDLHDRDSHQQNATEASVLDNAPDIDTTIHAPEVFLFDYGTVVIWGMTPAQESRFLSDISKFATSILSPEDTQVENFNFYYAREYQARIYNDFISLRDPRNYMIKLAISHALAQSVKTSLFEDLVSETISNTAPLPAQIAQTGSVNLSRRQINMQVGELFILRINIHLQGSVLDSPELMWAEPQLEPVYQAVRSYLEMDQRVSLLTERLDVIADLLAVLKDQLTHRHGEYLEWIVIVLIAAEILVAAINIVVDLYAGV
ncbi:YagE family protein, partial [Aspergillus foveolatus]|uniref:YagE family protein n=1 Tax=Aspergillus foveolatus TaxID=210207 RepID=UPI003CCCF629